MEGEMMLRHLERAVRELLPRVGLFGGEQHPTTAELVAEIDDWIARDKRREAEREKVLRQLTASLDAQ